MQCCDSIQAAVKHWEALLCICGITQNTRHSGCTVAALLTSLMAIFGNFRGVHFGCSTSEAHHLICDVTSLNDAVTSYVMTIYYKTAANASVGVLAYCLLVHQVQLCHQRPSCGWCLTHVGHNTSSASPGRSLLPLTVIIVLALVNSAVSPAGTHKYLNETWECCSTPC